MTRTRILVRTLALLVALAAVVGAAAPAASADGSRTLRTSLDLDLSIFDLYLTTACETNVTAELSGLLEKKVVLGKTPTSKARETITFHGTITWYAEETGASHSSALVNRVDVVYPEGIDLFAPAQVTVGGRHGGTFPIGGGPPGRGTLEYEALVYAVDDEGFPYWFVLGDPISRRGTHDRETQEICAALT